jgi:hypothetical protein
LILSGATKIHESGRRFTGFKIMDRPAAIWRMLSAAISLAVLFTPEAVIAKANLTDAQSDQIVKHCLANPVPSGVVPQDYCDCMSGFIDNDLSPEEYQELAAASYTPSSLSPALQTKIAKIDHECVGATTPAR